MADLERLQELCTMVKETSLCGLGQSAPNPVLSTIRYFHGRIRRAHQESSLPSRRLHVYDQAPVTDWIIGSRPSTNVMPKEEDVA